MVYNTVNMLMPQNYTLKNGLNGKFYVMDILQLKNKNKGTATDIWYHIDQP